MSGNVLNVRNKAINLNNIATKDANTAYTYSLRDDNANNNFYEGQKSNLNDKIVNAGGEYAYITQSGLARPVNGGIEGDWFVKNGISGDFTRFNSIPYSNCPDDVITLNDVESIDDIKAKNSDKSIYKGNSINNYKLTACGSEGNIVYINKFMDYDFKKIGGNTKWHTGAGINFTLLENWRADPSEWKAVAPLAAKLACNSGYKTIKITIREINNTSYIYCYATDAEAPAGLRNTYLTSKGGNKSTVSGKCGPTSKRNELSYPKGIENINQSDVNTGIPVADFQATSTGEYETTTNRWGNEHTHLIPCTKFVPFTQSYKVTCDEMSTQLSLSDELERCNAIYTVWYPNVKNTNIYVGNVGYITPDGKIKHFSKDLIQYDDDYKNLITYQSHRVCRHSKQFKSNPNQIMKTTSMSIEQAKRWCANNKNCAGFDMIEKSVTFFYKGIVYCGESLGTLNSMLPLTEDYYTTCTTVWKPLRDTLTINPTSSCPKTISFGLYGQLWYGYRNNGYSEQKDRTFICQTMQPDTISKYNTFMHSSRNANLYMKNTYVPAYTNLLYTNKKIHEASNKEGLTTMEEEYGDEIVKTLNQSLPINVTNDGSPLCTDDQDSSSTKVYDGNTYEIKDKHILNSYSVIQSQCKQGLITTNDRDIQLNALFARTPELKVEDKISENNNRDNPYKKTKPRIKSYDTVISGNVNANTDTLLNGLYNKTNPRRTSNGTVSSGNVNTNTDTIPKGLYQQINNTSNNKLTHSKEDSQHLTIMNEDSLVILMKNIYEYAGWIVLSLIIISTIVLTTFNIVPVLNTTTVLRPLTIGLGIISLIMLELKYGIIEIILKYFNKFIYN